MNIKLTKKTAIKSLICMILLTVNQAQAALVNFTVDAQIHDAAVGNSFGLLVGDIITASGQFDDSAIASGVIDFTTSFNNMSILFGNTLYTDEMDVEGGAAMFFTAEGIFDGISYLSVLESPGFESNGFVNGPFDVSGYDNTGLVDGTWQVGSYSSISAVPVPAAIWLFGSGLIGLAGIGRRKNQRK